MLKILPKQEATCDTTCLFLSLGIATLLNRIDLPSVTVAVDGSLFRFHPHFPKLMMDKTSKLAKPGIKVGHCKLLRLLVNCQPAVVRMLMRFYAGNVTRIPWNGVVYNYLGVTSVIKQSGVCIPVLFDVCICVGDAIVSRVWWLNWYSFC